MLIVAAFNGSFLLSVTIPLKLFCADTATVLNKKINVPNKIFIFINFKFTIMGTRNNAGECGYVKLTFPSQVLPCSGSTGVISASQFFLKSTPSVIII
jgi:hypothetical protein